MEANMSPRVKWGLALLSIPIMLWTVIPLLWMVALSFKDAASQSNAPDMNIVAAAVPVQDGFTGKSGMCVASWALGVTENSKNKVEAIKFITGLGQPANGLLQRYDARNCTWSSGRVVKDPGCMACRHD